MTNPAGPPPIRLAPGTPEDRRPLTAPSFYITGRQPLRPGAILLAIVIAVGALSLVLYAMSHAGGNFTQGIKVVIVKLAQSWGKTCCRPERR